MRWWVIGLAVSMLLGTFVWVCPTGAASAFADPAFQTQWPQREALAVNFLNV